MKIKICKNLANEIASNYMHFNDVLTLLNVLGNDFVHISDLNQFHKSFIKITGYMALNKFIMMNKTIKNKNVLIFVRR